jgi:prepilin-type processing-associated H-X9-DG protein
MEEQLLAYLLDALDEPAARQVEAYLAEHAQAREQLAVLERALAPLAADDAAPTPPLRLLERTLARVAESACAPPIPAIPSTLADLPKAPPISPSAFPVSRSWWRRADVLVAASVMVTIVGIGLTLLGSLRAPSSAALTAQCKNNLFQFFIALQTYHDQHRRFPDVASESPRDVAGMVVPILADAGVLSDSASIRCPGVGSPLACQIPLVTLRTMSNGEFEKYAPSLSMCYAYSLGYRDDEGAYHGPGNATLVSWSQLPVMADRPPAEGIDQNSVNHGADGKAPGQNVLFADGHVQFLTDRRLGGDDIFLNSAGHVAAGLNARDIVLGYSSARP